MLELPGQGWGVFQVGTRWDWADEVFGIEVLQSGGFQVQQAVVGYLEVEGHNLSVFQVCTS